MLYMLSLILGKSLALGIGAYCYKYLSQAYKLIMLQVAIALLAECYGRYLGLKGQHNAWVFNLQNLADLLLTGWAAKLLTGKPINKVIPFLLLLFTGLWAVNIYVDGFYQLAAWFFVSSCILLVLLYIAVLFNKSLFSNKRILEEPATWLAISVILYFGCSVPYFGLYHYLISNFSVTARNLWAINMWLDVLRCPLIAVCFLTAAKQQKQLRTA